MPGQIITSAQADYNAMWELIRPTCWAAHYDLAEVRGPQHKRPGRMHRKEVSRRLEDLRLEVTWMLWDAGYCRQAIADFLFISECSVKYRRTAWQARRSRP